jgi:hypothetical protein
LEIRRQLGNIDLEDNGITLVAYVECFKIE